MNPMNSHLIRSIAVMASLLLAAWSGAETFEKAATLNSQGVDLYKAKRYSEALASFSKAYEIAPDQDVIRKNLSNACQSIANDLALKSDFTGAARQLERAVDVDVRNPWPLIQLAACYLRLDRVNEAIYRLEEAVDLERQNVDAHDLLGDAYYRDGDAASALVQWEWVMQVRPGRAGVKEKVEKAKREQTVEKKYGRRESRHFQIKFAPGTNADSSRVLTALERAYMSIGRELGGVFPPGPIQVTVYTADDFSKATLLGEHVGAVYDGAIRVPVMDKHGAALSDEELQRRLYHEYVHVIVRSIAGEKAPWWLNEGLAETLSREMTPADLARLTTIYASGVAFPIQRLEEHQLAKLTPERLEDAYLQSHATVRYLWNRFGQGPMRKFMKLIAEGTTPEEALKASFNRAYAALDKEVSDSYHGG